MLFFLRRFLTCLFLFSLSTLSVQACLNESNPASEIVADDLYRQFSTDLEAMGMETFVARYCALLPKDRVTAIRIFGSAYEGLNKEDSFTLLRMAIMVPDIEENVAWVAGHARIREEGDDWESVSIKRFVSHVLGRFPATREVLDAGYMERIDQLFEAAVSAIRAKETAADKNIDQAGAQIADYEDKIKELSWKIEALKDERREYRVMRQTLEAEE